MRRVPRAAWRNALLEWLFLATLLGAVALWLLQLTQPTTIVVTLRTNVGDDLELSYSPEEQYIPYFRFEPVSGRARKRPIFKPVVFELANDLTRELRIKLGPKPKRIEIQSIAVQRLLTRIALHPAALANSFNVHQATSRVKDDVWVVETSGADASLEAQPAFIREMQTPAAQELALIIFLLCIAVVLLLLRFGARALLYIYHSTSHLPQAVRARVGNPLFALSLLLLLYGSFRVLFLVVHEPMIGSHNNGDFYRLQACLGWSARVPRDTAGNEITTESASLYRVTAAPVRGSCYLSSQSLLMLAARKAARGLGLLPQGLLDLRMLGLVTALALIAIGWGITLLYTGVSPAMSLASAAFFAVFLTDPMYTMLFNTLFAEPVLLLTAYLSISLLIYIAITAHWQGALVLSLAVAFFLLALGKQQTMLLPLTLLATLLLVLWRTGALTHARKRVWHFLALLGAAALLGAGIQLAQAERPGLMKLTALVNRFDSYYDAILPAMREPQVGLAILGLPQDCTSEIGKNWYNTSEPWGNCTFALETATPLKGLSLAAYDPNLIVNVLARALPMMFPWIGHAPWGIPKGTLESPAWSPYWSVAWWMDGLTREQYFGLFILFVVASALASLIILFAPRVPRPLVRWASAQLFLTVLGFYTLGVTLWGDGYFDIAKHTLLLRVPLLWSAVFLTGLVASPVAILRRRAVTPLGQAVRPHHGKHDRTYAQDKGGG